MLKKQYLKSKPVCKVTFVLPEDIDAETAHLVGDFNEWGEVEIPMKQLKSGEFKITLPLETNREYQYRYLVNGEEWHNDWDADKYVPNPFCCENSVVVT
ncbi:MAG: glycoside hydrolase [Chloroflexi bacterium]|nr:MAG: glycoside hydrolase [Chloroflexota bacterium]